MEGIISELRGRGANQIESVKTLRSLRGLSLYEAKDLIDNSDTWADRRAGNQVLREGLAQKLLDDEGGQD